MGFYVYKYVNDGKVIYVGKANSESNLENRLYAHGKSGDNINQKYWDEINKSEIYVTEFSNGLYADIMETILINLYNPKCNKAKKSHEDLPFSIDLSKIKWKEFERKKPDNLKEKYQLLKKQTKDLEEILYAVHYFLKHSEKHKDAYDYFCDQIMYGFDDILKELEDKNV